MSCSGVRASGYRETDCAAPARWSGGVPATGDIRLDDLCPAAHDAGNRADVSFAETGTLPWLTRKHGPFEVAITIRAKRLPVGVFPLASADHALAVIGRAFPGVIEPCGDALSGALMNAGPIIHPPLIVMNAGPIEHFERWDIHKEGTQAADSPRHRRTRCRAHRRPRGAWLWRAAFSARTSLCQRRRDLDVWPRLARPPHRFRRLARATGADRSSLHAGRSCGWGCRSWSPSPN